MTRSINFLQQETTDVRRPSRALSHWWFEREDERIAPHAEMN
jgi:hypothetical protein